MVCLYAMGMHTANADWGEGRQILVVSDPPWQPPPAQTVTAQGVPETGLRGHIHQQPPGMRSGRLTGLGPSSMAAVSSKNLV